MTNPLEDAVVDVYELTLVGGLGPVLRQALGPSSVSAAHVCTVVYAEAAPDVDLVDLMASLDGHGLTVEVIALT